MKKIKLEFTSDTDMCLLFEKGMRNRASYISTREIKADNQHLKFYEAKQESKNILYLVLNNLYGYAMSNFFFLTDGFKCVYPKEFDSNK